MLTFDRHPAEVVRPGSAPKLLTTLDQKLELLDATGAVDECLVLPFDEDAQQGDRRRTSSRGARRACCGARLVVVGADFHFGYRRHGDVALLQHMGAELGFEVLGLGLVAPPSGDADGTRRTRRPGSASCSARRRRRRGRDLGRPHEVRGVGRARRRRGRELGFPTANVARARRICLPADGVYAGTFVGADGVERPAAISLGRRPTFYADAGHVAPRGATCSTSTATSTASRPRSASSQRLAGPGALRHVDDLIEQMGSDVEPRPRDWPRGEPGAGSRPGQALAVVA